VRALHVKQAKVAVVSMTRRPGVSAASFGLTQRALGRGTSHVDRIEASWRARVGSIEDKLRRDRRQSRRP